MFLNFNAMVECCEQTDSAFLEIQYCRLPRSEPLKSIVSVNSIKHWNSSSLYVYFDDLDDFYREYANIFQDGTYNNLSDGKIDIYGINYYNAEKVQAIVKRMESMKPKKYEILLEWLNDNINQNGIYILGV